MKKKLLGMLGVLVVLVAFIVLFSNYLNSPACYSRFFSLEVERDLTAYSERIIQYIVEHDSKRTVITNFHREFWKFKKNGNNYGTVSEDISTINRRILRDYYFDRISIYPEKGIVVYLYDRYYNYFYTQRAMNECKGWITLNSHWFFKEGMSIGPLDGECEYL